MSNNGSFEEISPLKSNGVFSSPKDNVTLDLRTKIVNPASDQLLKCLNDDMYVSLMCEECYVLICYKCLATTHVGHRFIPLWDNAKLYDLAHGKYEVTKGMLDCQAETLEQKALEYEKVLGYLEDFKRKLNACIDKINDTKEKIKKEVNKRENYKNQMLPKDKSVDELKSNEMIKLLNHCQNIITDLSVDPSIFENFTDALTEIADSFVVSNSLEKN